MKLSDNQLRRPGRPPDWPVSEGLWFARSRGSAGAGVAAPPLPWTFFAKYSIHGSYGRSNCAKYSFHTTCAQSIDSEWVRFAAQPEHPSSRSRYSLAIRAGNHVLSFPREMSRASSKLATFAEVHRLDRILGGSQPIDGYSGSWGDSVAGATYLAPVAGRPL